MFQEYQWTHDAQYGDTEVTCSSLFLSRYIELLTRDNDLVTRGNEILIRWNELVILKERIS